MKNYPRLRLFEKGPPITIKNLMEIFPNERWTVISQKNKINSELIVEWASPRQLEFFPNIVGKCCYKFTKGLSTACKNCPCLRSLFDNTIKIDVIPTPYYLTNFGKIKGEYNDIGDLIYTVIIAIPLKAKSNGTRRVLEFSYDITKSEKFKHNRRTKRWQFLNNLIDLLNPELGSDTINDYILYGAVSKEGLGFDNATLYIPKEFYKLGAGIPVFYISEVLEIKRRNFEDNISDQIKNVNINFNLGLDLNKLRVNLIKSIESKSIEKNRNLFDLLRSKGIFNPYRIKDNLLLKENAIRIHSRKAIAPIMGLNDKLHSILLVEWDNRLVNEECLRLLTTYSLFLNKMYVSRDLSRAFEQSNKRMLDLTKSFEMKPNDLLFTGSIISSMGHELKSTSRNISDWINIIIGLIPKDKINDQKIRPLVEELQYKVEYQSNCIKKITNPGRILKPFLSNNNIVLLLKNFKSSFEHTLKSENATLDIYSDLRYKEETVEIDEFLIEQLFTNLISNSVYWMNKSRRKNISIYIRLEDDKSFIIDYSDTGPGISKEFIHKIGEPFFTLKPNGLGLGMFIVKRIVSVHNGTFTPYFRANKGACFKIVIPRFKN